ncbi:MAG: nucleotidyl transferase AbiEii/AbiGii toxin family protein [Candidatus Sumerlaeota bacterium]|nr:nucleotidyl transferase AbiEii/AbiGii toxin family protein [Candidatus Sumerlaeota bacterium]
MIENKYFTKAWISEKSAQMGNCAQDLLEKAIHALALLGELASRHVPLVFKGGTSLLLRLPRIRRLSIDLDILCSLPPPELDSILNDISQTPPFVRYEEDHRGPHRLPVRRHFKFYYAPLVARDSMPYVILDVVGGKNIYPQTEKIAIKTQFFELDFDVKVTVPTIEGLLADKLTAFAPNTVGIRLADETALQVMKQMFDIGELFNAAESLEATRRAYEAIFAAENGYRGAAFTLEEALNDALQTARLICQTALRGGETTDRTHLLEQGRKRLQNHLVANRFSQDEAKIAASKAACLAAALKCGLDGRLLSDLRYREGARSSLRDTVLADGVLNRLKKSSPEAFHYWRQVERIQQGKL